MVWVVSKCSIYHVQSPISLIFKGLQTPHFSTIFEKILGIILFYANKVACHILVMICEPCRIPSLQDTGIFLETEVIPRWNKWSILH